MRRLWRCVWIRASEARLQGPRGLWCLPCLQVVLFKPSEDGGDPRCSTSLWSFKHQMCFTQAPPPTLYYVWVGVTLTSVGPTDAADSQRWFELRRRGLPEASIKGWNWLFFVSYMLQQSSCLSAVTPVYFSKAGASSNMQNHRCPNRVTLKRSRTQTWKIRLVIYRLTPSSTPPFSWGFSGCFDTADSGLWFIHNVGWCICVTEGEFRMSRRPVYRLQPFLIKVSSAESFAFKFSLSNFPVQSPDVCEAAFSL